MNPRICIDCFLYRALEHWLEAEDLSKACTRAAWICDHLMCFCDVTFVGWVVCRGCHIYRNEHSALDLQARRLPSSMARYAAQQGKGWEKAGDTKEAEDQGIGAPQSRLGRHGGEAME